MESIEIKEAELKDLKYILSLNQQLFDYEYQNFDKTTDCSWPSRNENYFKKSITSENSLALVVIKDGKVIGYLIGRIKKAEDYRNLKQIGEIDNMFVLPAYRKKGAGGLLCERFIKWAKKKGVKRIRVAASAENIKAINFYKKNNFKDYDLNLERDI